MSNHNNKRNKRKAISFYNRTLEAFSAYRKTHVQQTKLSGNYDKLQVFWTTIECAGKKLATNNVNKLITKALGQDSDTNELCHL